jgi:hypothetical protein
VARILIYEPHEDIEALLRLVVERLGHQPISWADDGELLEVDAAVIEPGDRAGPRLARELRLQRVALLFTSIYPPTPELLALEPVAYLIKPFPLLAVERALEHALAVAGQAA